MKKGLLVFLLLLAVSIMAGAQSGDALSGRVAAVETWVYTAEMHFGETVENWDSHKATTYDTEGNIIEEVEYSSSGKIVSKTEHKYDASYCRVESVQYGSSGEIERQTRRKCDSSGREIQTDVYDSTGRLTSKSLTEYVGNLAQERGYDASGALTFAMDVEKDGSGNITRMVLYDEKTGKPNSVMEDTYTSDGKTLSTLMYNENGEQLGEIRFSYSYDKDGMDEITTTTLYLAGVPFRNSTEGMVILSDSVGNWTEKRTYKQEEQFGKVQWILTDVERRTIRYR